MAEALADEQVLQSGGSGTVTGAGGLSTSATSLTYSGNQVNATNENGYILYFSDRRGMRPDPNPTGNGLYNRITGMSGLIPAFDPLSI